MVELEVTRTTVLVRVRGLHKLWALRGKLTLDRSAITDVAIADTQLRPALLRLPGTYLPSVIAAGTYRGRGRKEFWDTRFKGQAIRIDLTGPGFTRIVVDVADPRSAVRKLAATQQS